jgi:hypothetical protein
MLCDQLLPTNTPQWQRIPFKSKSGINHIFKNTVHKYSRAGTKIASTVNVLPLSSRHIRRIFSLPLPESSHCNIAHLNMNIKYKQCQAKTSGSMSLIKLQRLRCHTTFTEHTLCVIQRSRIRSLYWGSVTLIILSLTLLLSVSENSSMCLLLVSFSNENEERNFQFHLCLKRENGFAFLSPSLKCLWN